MTETEHESCKNIPLFNKGYDVDQMNNSINSENSSLYDGLTDVRLESPPISQSSDTYTSDKISPNSNVNIKLTENVSSNILSENAKNETSPHVENGDLCNSKDISSDIFKFTETDLSKLTPEDDKNDPDISVADLKRAMFKRNLNKIKSADEKFEDLYQGVCDRTKHLVSEDHDNEKLTKEDSLSESKRLTLDPHFEQKMKDLFHVPSMSCDIESYGCKKSEKIYVKRKEFSCEIVEENLSPVSTTTKQLEQHLQFPQSPKSPGFSPRIPKLSRFARLNRFLSESPEPQISENVNQINP